MKRKKFIGMLMSQGFQRNAANAIVKSMNTRKGWSYDSVYPAFKITSAVTHAFRKLTQACVRSAVSFEKAFEAVNEAAEMMEE